jgi:hypothetical protein
VEGFYSQAGKPKNVPVGRVCCSALHAATALFPDGPSSGIFTFTRKINGTIDFGDRDATYTVSLLLFKEGGRRCIKAASYGIAIR